MPVFTFVLLVYNGIHGGWNATMMESREQCEAVRSAILQQRVNSSWNTVAVHTPTIMVCKKVQ